jgi:AcrR family transcriptional regulator
VKESRRREAILEAASRLFRHYGPFKTTVADIAREAQLGVGTVYLEFKSKDAILTALSGIRHESVLVSIERAWGNGHPAARCLQLALDARFEAFLRCKDDGAHGVDLVSGSCAATAEAHRCFRDQERALFARFLRDAKDELSVRDPDQDARVLLLAYRAFEPPHMFGTPIEELRADLARVHVLVMRGLLPRASKAR